MNKIPFTPRWQGAIEGHAVNTVRRFFPSLCAENEFDDLMQEAYIVFMRCKAKYSKVDNGAWFMALYSNSLRNKLINMVARCGRTISLEEVGPLPEPSGGENDGYARALLAELPDAVKQLINTVCFGPGAEGRAAFRKLRQVFPTLQ